MTVNSALPQHLLFATDLGARTDRAQDRANGLARKWNARLTVVHALDVFDAPNDQAARPTVERAEERALRMIRSQFKDDVEIVVEKGKPEDVVLRAARARPVDLIVTGIAGNDPLGQSILGNTTTTLVRKSLAPILVVKKRDIAPYRRVVVASDLSEASSNALEVATRLFEPSQITLYHVFDVPFGAFVDDRTAYERDLEKGALDEARKFASRHLGTKAAELDVAVATGDAAVRVADYAAETDADLVIAGTHGRTGILGVLMGSVAVALLDEVPCDVMIVPSKGARQSP